jgi:signal transduction histidine kinase/ActR/RegA family two-component response regulator
LPEKLKGTKLAAEARTADGQDKAPLLGQILIDLGYATEEQIRYSLQELKKITDAYIKLGSEELKIVLETGSLINSSLDLEEVLELIMKSTNKVTSSIAGSLMLLDVATGELVLSVSTGPKSNTLKDIRIPVGTGIAGWVAANERHVLVDDVQKDKRFYVAGDKINGIKTKSILCVPLKAKSNLIGVLEVINKVDGTSFTQRDVLLLGIFASQAAMAIENARLYGELKAKLENEKEMQQRLARLEKMQALGLLAGGVAHDLNNVLSGIASYPDFLLMNLPADSPLRKPLSIIQNSGEKAAAIVQDLLTLARRNVNDAEVLNLNAVISDYLNSPEHQKIKNLHPDIHIKTTLEPNLLNIEGFPIHLKKSIMNLVLNAAEAQPDGGLIIISTKNRYVDMPISAYDYVKEGDFVVLTIEDRGGGISPEDLNRIFEPFYTSKVIGRSGTGLGMTVVWNTVQDHKGYIDVKSTEENGTTFDLYFPITRKEIPEEKSSLPLREYMGGGERILVVDDVEEQREIASSMLSQLDYKVDAVSSGEEAVEYMKNRSPDILVLDMIMSPGIDGLETYRRIIKTHPKQKAVIVSGFSETERVKKAQAFGAGPYLKKPYTMEQIGIAIRTELATYSQPGLKQAAG